MNQLDLFPFGLICACNAKPSTFLLSSRIAGVSVKTTFSLFKMVKLNNIQKLEWYCNLYSLFKFEKIFFVVWCMSSDISWFLIGKRRNFTGWRTLVDIGITQIYVRVDKTLNYRVTWIRTLVSCRTTVYKVISWKIITAKKLSVCIDIIFPRVYYFY